MKTENIKFTGREDATKEDVDFSKLEWVESVPSRTGMGVTQDLPPRISISPTCIYLNRTAKNLMKDSKEVVIGWDKENKILALRPVRNGPGKSNVPDKARRFALKRPASRRDYIQIFSSPLCRSILRSLSVEEKKSIAFLAEYLPDRDMVIVDMTDPID